MVDAEAFDEPQGALELRAIGEGGHSVHQQVPPSSVDVSGTPNI